MIKDDLFEILQSCFPNDNLRLSSLTVDPNLFCQTTRVMSGNRKLKAHWMAFTDEEMFDTYKGINCAGELFGAIVEQVGYELGYWKLNTEGISTEECLIPMWIDPKTGKPPVIMNYREHPKWPKGL